MIAKYKNTFIHLSAWLLIVLFLYTASDKLWNFREFKEFLGRLEYLGPYNHLLAVAIPIAEIAISLVLLMPSLRTEGLYSALLLMLGFTVYLVYMRITHTELPCHCGGAISRLSWLQHIWFNIGLILMLVLSVIWSGNKKSVS